MSDQWTTDETESAQDGSAAPEVLDDVVTEAPETEATAEGMDPAPADVEDTDDEDIDEENVDEDGDIEPVVDPVKAFKDDLASKFGDWYVIHTYSGMENRVKQNLDARIVTLGMEDYIFESVVPTEDVVEIRNGTRKTVTRTVLPGYVLVRMDLTDGSWATVRQTPSVTGFVAHASLPVPLSIDEVVKMLAPAALAKAAAASTGKERKKKKVEVADFSVGDSVMVVQGPFAGVHASITEINANNQRIKALVEILGRETPVDLTFSQIQKD